ncbi:hypothetical protein [Streptomyces luteogriseus]|uniref:hypothetical protein n=1 Tax=Streptomyces luteogriseus TaxID=68233 RepID=UPI0036A5C345
MASAAPGIPQRLQRLTSRPSSDMTATGTSNADSHPVYRVVSHLAWADPRCAAT